MAEKTTQGQQSEEPKADYQVRRAEKVRDFYTALGENDGELHDLLTDIMVMYQEYGLNFQNELYLARENYREEVIERAPKAPAPTFPLTVMIRYDCPDAQSIEEAALDACNQIGAEIADEHGVEVYDSKGLFLGRYYPETE